MRWFRAREKATAAQPVVIPAGEKRQITAQAIAAREARKAAARARQAEKRKQGNRKKPVSIRVKRLLNGHRPR